MRAPTAFCRVYHGTIAIVPYAYPERSGIVESYIPPPSKGLCFARSLLPPILYSFVIQGLALYMFVVPDLNAIYKETGVAPNTGVNTMQNAPHFPHALLFGAMAGIILFQFMHHRNAKYLPANTKTTQASVIPFVLLVSIAGNYAFTAGITIAQNLLGTDLPTSALDGVGENADIFLLLLTTCVIVPVAEEFCFRALTMNYLRRGFPFMQANLIQAAIFGVIHGTPIAIGYAFLFGLFLGWVYHHTGRIGIVFLSHIAFNSSNLFLSFIPGIDTFFQSTGQMVFILFLPSLLAVAIGFTLLNKSFKEI